MIQRSHQTLFITLVAGLSLAAATVSAQGLPAADALDTNFDDDVVVEEEASEAAEAEVADRDDGEGAEEDEAEVRDDEWVNPMRARISPSMTREGSGGSGSVTSAASPGAMMYQVGLLGSASGGSDVIRLNDQNRSFIGKVLVNGSLHENFGLFFGLQARNNVNTFGRPQAMLSQGDMHLGGVGRTEVRPGVWLGGDLTLYVPSSFGSVGLSAAGMSVRPRLLASFDVDTLSGAQDDLVVPLVAHLNLGFRFDNSEALVPEGLVLDRVERFAYGVTAYNMLEIGVGVEVPVPYVTPYLGWTLGVPVNPAEGICGFGRALECVSQAGPGSFPQALGLGLKGEPLQNLGLHLGLDLGLTQTHAEGLPMTLPYQVNFGVTWNIDGNPPVELEEREVETIVEVEPTRGFLVGRVLDQETGNPVPDAKIQYLDREESPQLSRDGTGLFQSYPFEPGQELNLEVSHPHYEVTWASWVVDEGTHEMDIFLEPLPRAVSVRGRVNVPEGADLDEVMAFITGGDGETQPLSLEDDGSFTAEVHSGLVTVSASLEGFMTAGRDAMLDAGSDDSLDVAITREESEVIVGVSETDLRVQGRIEFESGTSTMLDDAREILDVVAAVLFENPQLRRIQIQGHTDDAGDEDYNMDLSQRRADAVAQYLQERGVSSERLDPEGFGSANPLVPNTSRRNRMLNRRIEFRFQD